MSGMYAFPGGKMDYLEKDPKETIVRETKEEVGVNLIETELLGSVDEFFPENNLHFFVFYFLAKKWEGEIVNVEPEKCKQWEWLDINSLPDNISPYVKIILNKHKDIFNNDL